MYANTYISAAYVYNKFSFVYIAFSLATKKEISDQPIYQLLKL